MPSPPDAGFDGGDKVGHLLAYAVLMAWFCALYRRTPVRVSYGLAFIGMGIALEFAQGALGYRAFEVPDILANTAGVLAGWAAALAGHRILRR